MTENKSLNKKYIINIQAFFIIIIYNNKFIYIEKFFKNNITCAIKMNIILRLLEHIIFLFNAAILYIGSLI